MSIYADRVYARLKENDPTFCPMNAYEEQRSFELNNYREHWEELDKAFLEGNLDRFPEIDVAFYEIAPLYAQAIDEYTEALLNMKPQRNRPPYLPILISVHPLTLSTLVLRSTFSFINRPTPVLKLALFFFQILRKEVEMIMWSVHDIENGGKGLAAFHKRFPNPGERVVNDWLKEKRKEGLRSKMPDCFNSEKEGLKAGVILLKLLCLTCPDIFEITTGNVGRKRYMTVFYSDAFRERILNKVADMHMMSICNNGMMFAIPKDYVRKDEKTK